MSVYAALINFEKGRSVDLTFWSELHMTHELASAFQQAVWIGQLGATKKSDIDVSSEGVDIGECRVSYAGGRMAVMQ